MPTFPRGFWTGQTHARNTQLRRSLQRHTQTSPGTITWLIEPGNLRGIPAIGRNCPGRIAGTRPDAITDRDD